MSEQANGKKLEAIISKLAECYQLEAQGKAVDAQSKGIVLQEIIKALTVQEYKELKQVFRKNLESFIKTGNLSLVLMVADMCLKAIEFRNDDFQKEKEIVCKIHIEYAKAHSSKESSPEAEAHFIKALQLVPNDPEALISYANFLGINRKCEAEEYSQKALDLTPNDPAANNRHANLLWNLDLNDKAEKYFEKALELKVDFSEAHYEYANLLLEQGRKRASECHFIKAIKFGPDYPNVYNSYASLLNNLGRFKESEHYYKKAIELAERQSSDKGSSNETVANFRTEFALFFLSRGKFQECKSELSKIKEPHSQKIVAAKLLFAGIIDYYLSRFTESKNKIEACLKIKGGQIIHYMLGIVHLSLKEYEKAAEYLDKALVAKPEDDSYFLQKIYSKYLSAEFEKALCANMAGTLSLC